MIMTTIAAGISLVILAYVLVIVIKYITDII